MNGVLNGNVGYGDGRWAGGQIAWQSDRLWASCSGSECFFQPTDMDSLITQSSQKQQQQQNTRPFRAEGSFLQPSEQAAGRDPL